MARSSSRVPGSTPPRPRTRPGPRRSRACQSGRASSTAPGRDGTAGFGVEVVALAHRTRKRYRYHEGVAAYQIRLFGDPVLTQRAARSPRSTAAWLALSRTWWRPCTTPTGWASPPPRSGSRSGCSSTSWRTGSRWRSLTRSSPRAAASGSTRRAACRSPGCTSRSCGPRRSTSPGGTSTATRSRSRPTSSRPAASSTSSTTSTAASCSAMLDKDQRKEAMRELRRRAEAVGS